MTANRERPLISTCHPKLTSAPTASDKTIKTLTQVLISCDTYFFLISNMYTKSLLANNELFSLSKFVYAKGHGFTPHSHKETAISVVLNGIMHEKVNGQLQVGKGAVTIIKPAEVVHENLFAEECTILCLYLHKDQNSQVDTTGVLEEWKWRRGLNCLPFLVEILRSKTERQARENLASMLRYIANYSANPAPGVPFWLADVKDHIDNYFFDAVNVTELARKYKVHRVYLARAFHQYYGQNIKSYLKALRLNHSAASLIKGDSVRDVALSNGFSDQSHLQRVFKEQTLQTPVQFKQRFNKGFICSIRS